MTTYQAFFKEIFHGLSDGYVPIVFSNTETGEFPSSTSWIPVRRIHSEAGLELAMSREDPFHIYFPCHPYKESTHRRKDNACQKGTCVWIECDDEHFNPYEVEEAEPSCIVHTSPGRCHVYWFLDEPEDIDLIEMVNKNLTYKYLKHDLSGWDIGQLLRVPNFINRKRDVPYEIEIKEFHPQRRYSFNEIFGHFAPLPDGNTRGVRSDQLDIPRLEDLPEYDTIYEKYSQNFTNNFVKALKHRSPDRSRSLWYLHNECVRMNMSPLEAYTLARSSPNNKFADNRYHADGELWTDVCSAFRMAEQNVPQHLQARLESIRTDKGHPDTKRQKISEEVYDHMHSSGRFYYAPTMKRAYFNIRRREIRISDKDPEFQSYINYHYLINPASQEFPYLTNFLFSKVREEKPKVQLYDISHYNERDNVLYVTDNAGGMFRMDGQEATKIQELDSGTDSLILTFPEKALPIKVNANYDEKSPLDEYVLNLPNYDPQHVNREDAMFLIRTWLYSMFLMDSGKGILVIEGSRGSGKSTLFKALEWVITGPRGDVKELPDSSSGLKEVVRGQHHMFFDGVDNAPAWMQNTLSTIATGSEERKRILYTDDTYATYRLNAAVGLSTMNATFLREDVVDRSIILKVKRFSEFISIDKIRQDIVEHRDAIWCEILTDLNQIVKRLETWETKPSILRMSNFVQFLYILCELKGRDPHTMELFLQGVQDAAVLNEEPVWDTLKLWLENEDNLGRTVSPGELYKEMCTLSATQKLGFGEQIKSAKQLSWKLKELGPNIHIVTFTTTSERNRNMFRFDALTKE